MAREGRQNRGTEGVPPLVEETIADRLQIATEPGRLVSTHTFGIPVRVKREYCERVCA